MAKKQTEKAKTAEIVEADSPELGLALQDGSAVAAFVANLRVFFKQAEQLDMGAQATLARMEAMRLPTNAAEDELVMNEVRAINAMKKTVDEHWSVTSLLSRLHKWTVSRRERAGRALDQAALIGNNLHGTYKQAEIRRAQQEQLRLQREQEERARVAHEAQLKKLEDEALKAEASSPDLSERERIFVDRYMSLRNGEEAARQAGFKDKQAAALRLLKLPKILKAIEAAEKAIALRKQAVAIKEAPVEVENVVVKPDIAQGGDVTRWSCEIVDVDAFRQAYLSGKYGLPIEAVLPNVPCLNELARSLQSNLNRIPGLRAKMTTSVR